MNVSLFKFRFGLSALIIAVVSLNAAPKPEYGSIEVLRDSWGIPHVFSETDAGAMYGLGHATAQERGFQMTYNLRIIQGRLAELIGDRPNSSGKETALEHDRRMRTFGWARAAARTAANLDDGTRRLLEAYCEGVNDSFAGQRKTGTLHPLFQQLETNPEPWTVADCLLSWWHLAQFFAGDGTRELIVWRNRVMARPGQPQPPKANGSWVDDSTAVVQRADVSDTWLRRVEEFCSSHGLRKSGTQPEAPKFSHAWVVGGQKTTTGAAVLVSDPQTPVRNPSLWMEFHVCGKTFDARGIGVPGSPGLLIGFNQRVAWGLTALGADQADLFRLETSPDHSDEYRWDGTWRKMEVRTERIAVKNGRAVKLSIRETHLGPVASAFCFQQAGDPEVALKRVPMCEPQCDTIQGVLGMMRAQNAREFAQALGDWRFPSANCVYGDADGHIGYAVLGAIPVRSRFAEDAGGNEAMIGAGTTNDWQGFVPPDLLPQVVDPQAGLLFSANHRAIGSFYEIPMGTSTGSMGDTIRSWRLRELLAPKIRYSPADVLAIHYDTVNPARRELVRLGLHLRDTKQGVLSPEALESLEVLEKWLQSGASSDLKTEGAELATRLSTFFRFVATPLALTYGGGESGLARFLKDAAARIKADPKARFEEEASRFIDKVFADAWSAGGGRSERSGRGQNTRALTRSQPLGWFDSLDGFGSLDHREDVSPLGITCLDGQTIHSQSGQSYTQWVPLGDLDSAQTVCPIGHSDRPGSRYRTSTLSLWGEAKLHPAPLSRKAVEKITAERIQLAPSPNQ